MAKEEYNDIGFSSRNNHLVYIGDEYVSKTYCIKEFVDKHSLVSVTLLDDRSFLGKDSEGNLFRANASNYEVKQDK